MLTPDRHLFEDIFLLTAQAFPSTTHDESLPVWRLEYIGRIRDCVAYFAPTGKKERGATYLGGITEVLRMARRKRGGQTSLCTMAERVAALREVTPSLL